MTSVHRPPPFMIGFAFLGWGILTGETLIGILLALLTEGTRAIKWRWRMEDDQVVRLWDSVALLYLSTTVIMFIRLGPNQMLYALVKWTPVITFPLLLVQRLSASDTVALHSFSVLGKYVKGAARGYHGQPERPERHANIEYPFVCVIALGAAMAPSDNGAFFMLISILLGWSLWMIRKSYGHRARVWLPAFVIAVSVGYAGQLGIHTLHSYIEQRFYGLFTSGEMTTGPDQNGFTSIGRVGRVKQSPNIVWRLYREKGAAPSYLKATTYGTYVRGLWSNSQPRSEYEQVPAFRANGRKNWLIAGDSNRVYATRFRMLGRGIGTPEGLMQNAPSANYSYLVLPDETGVVTDLDQGDLQINPIRTVRTLAADEVVQFSVLSDPDISREPPPSRTDLTLPEAERPGIRRVAESIGLHDRVPQDAVRAVARFFASEFSYSTYLTIKEDINPRSRTALTRFLEDVRKGHCEYFAAATVLLLREARVPARYVVGYRVSEYDRKRDVYLIRGLHAHAWAEAWLDGRWVTVDNTPPVWQSSDRGILTWFQPLKDWMGGIPLALALWQRSPEGERAMALLTWIGIPLIVFWLFYRVMKGQSTMERVARKRKGQTASAYPGQDSEFYDLEKQLAAILGPRPCGSPVRSWYSGKSDLLPEPLTGLLPEIIKLHYAYRFTGQELESPQRRQLADLAEQCQTVLSALQEPLPPSPRPQATAT